MVVWGVDFLNVLLRKGEKNKLCGYGNAEDLGRLGGRRKNTIKVHFVNYFLISLKCNF